MARPPIVFNGDSATDQDELVEARYHEAHKVLEAHWSHARRWEPWAHEGFYATWAGLATYGWALLRCQLTRHQWNDSTYNLTGQAGEFRDCERC